MNTYTHITIDDKKVLVYERMKNNENALYHLNIGLIESNTNGATSDEVDQINEGIARAQANMITLSNILDNLNNNIDLVWPYMLWYQRRNKMTTLTNEEKAAIVNQHIKNLEYSKFNLELSLVEENAVASSDSIVSLESQLAELNLKKTALLEELAKVD